MTDDRPLSRRGFAALAAAGFQSSASGAQSVLTATQVVDRIKRKLAEEGVAWGPSVFDGFHLGEPDILVRGVAVTFQPTFGVLKRALAANKNFVISHESTFWDGFDPVEVMLKDPVCQAKIRFAKDNRMAVWRIHDHWHRRKPEPIFTGLAAKLGWTSYYRPDNRPRHYEIPEMPLLEVARHIQEKLGTRNVVVVGDPQLRVQNRGRLCARVIERSARVAQL